MKFSWIALLFSASVLAQPVEPRLYLLARMIMDVSRGAAQ